MADQTAIGHLAAETNRSDDLGAAPSSYELESLETEPDPAVEQAWAKEIERRVAELDAGTVETVPWDTVKARLLGRLRES